MAQLLVLVLLLVVVLVAAVVVVVWCCLLLLALLRCVCCCPLVSRFCTRNLPGTLRRTIAVWRSTTRCVFVLVYMGVYTKGLRERGLLGE